MRLLIHVCTCTPVCIINYTLCVHPQGYELIRSVESEDQKVRYIYCEEFSKVIVAVVQHYLVKISQHIPEYVHNLEKTCMLLNNIHALRIDIQELFNVMGGQEVRQTTDSTVTATS